MFVLMQIDRTLDAPVEDCSTFETEQELRSALSVDEDGSAFTEEDFAELLETGVRYFDKRSVYQLMQI